MRLDFKSSTSKRLSARKKLRLKALAIADWVRKEHLLAKSQAFVKPKASVKPQTRVKPLFVPSLDFGLTAEQLGRIIHDSYRDRVHPAVYLSACALGYKMGCEHRAKQQKRRRDQAHLKDEARWITVHPHGKGAINERGEDVKGQPVLIESETGQILGGMGGKHNGKTMKLVKQETEERNRQKRIQAGLEKPSPPSATTIPQTSIPTPPKEQVERFSNKFPNRLEVPANLIKLGLSAPFKGVAKIISSSPSLRGAKDSTTNPVFQGFARRENQENAALFDPKWRPKDGVSFSNPDEQAEYDSVLHDALAYRALKRLYVYYALGDNRTSEPLSAQVIEQGEAAEKRLTQMRDSYARDVGVKDTQAKIENFYQLSSNDKSDVLISGLLNSKSLFDSLANDVTWASYNRPKKWAQIKDDYPFDSKLFKQAFAQELTDLPEDLGDKIKHCLDNSTDGNPVFKQFILLSAIDAAVNRLEYDGATFSVETMNALQDALAQAKHNYSLQNNDLGITNCLARDVSRCFISKQEPPTKNLSNLCGQNKGDPMSFEEANEQRGNPNYSKGVTVWNPRKGKYVNAYGVNCQSCVVAYEMRVRGYDVSAQARTYDGSNNTGDLARHCPLIWVNKTTKAAPDVIPLSRFYDLDLYIQGKQRFHVMYEHSEGGHIVTAEKDEKTGEIMIYDPQIGERFTLSQYNNTHNAVRISCYRVDDCDILDKYAAGVLEKRPE